MRYIVLLCGIFLGSCGENSSSTGNCTVAIGPASPTNTELPVDGENITLLQLRFTAGSSEDIRISSITLTLSGTEHFHNLGLYIDANHDGIHDSSETSIEDPIEHPSGDKAEWSLLHATRIIPAGESIDWLVAADINGSVGSEITISLTSEDDITASGGTSYEEITVNGVYPLASKNFAIGNATQTTNNNIFQNVTTAVATGDSNNRIHALWHTSDNHTWYGILENNSWTNTILPVTIEPVAFALNSKNDPYALSYESSGLTLTWFDSGSWKQEIAAPDVTQGSFGIQASMAIDGSDVPHIFWPDWDLWWAHRDGSSWKVDSVEDIAGDLGPSTAVKDTQGKIHLVYWHNHYGLRHAVLNSEQWDIEEANGSDDDLGPRCTLAVDAAKHIHIVAPKRNQNTNIQHAWYNGIQWQVENVSGITGQVFSIALNENQIPHLAALAGTSLWYGTRDSGSWEASALYVSDIQALISLIILPDASEHLLFLEDSGTSVDLMHSIL